MLVRVEFTKYYSVAANSSLSNENFNIASYIPPGYKLLDVFLKSTGDSNVAICYGYSNASGSIMAYAVKNTASYTVSNVFKFSAICVKIISN